MSIEEAVAEVGVLIEHPKVLELAQLDPCIHLMGHVVAGHRMLDPDLDKLLGYGIHFLCRYIIVFLY